MHLSGCRQWPWWWGRWPWWPWPPPQCCPPRSIRTLTRRCRFGSSACPPREVAGRTRRFLHSAFELRLGWGTKRSSLDVMRGLWNTPSYHVNLIWNCLTVSSFKLTFSWIRIQVNVFLHTVGGRAQICTLIYAGLESHIPSLTLRYQKSWVNRWIPHLTINVVFVEKCYLSS